MRLHRIAGIAAALVTSALLTTTPASASATKTTAASSAVGATCSRPVSDAEALQILNYYYPNRYVWDHTNLTIAVAAAPKVSQAQLDAIHRALATWDSVLRDCFDGLITLTEVTARRTADIVVHYVPHAGGVVFGGFAVCCNNVIVRSDLPPSLGLDPYSPEHLYNVTLHEVGHALGLGHATNLLESTDLMGYGWNRTNGITPVLSQCDIDALAYLFSRALNGTAPPGPGPSSFDSTFDCSAA